MKRLVGLVTMVAAAVGAWAFWRRNQQQPVVGPEQMERGKVLLSRAADTARSAAAQAATTVTSGVRTATDTARMRATEMSGRNAASSGSSEYGAVAVDVAAGGSGGTVPSDTYGASVMGADDEVAASGAAGGGVVTTDDVLSGSADAAPTLEGVGSGAQEAESGDGSDIEGLLLETSPSQSVTEPAGTNDVEMAATAEQAGDLGDGTAVPHEGQARGRRRSSDA